MHDAFDESGRAGRAREDGMPVGEGKVGGEHKALLFVASTDDLEDQVGVAIGTTRACATRSVQSSSWRLRCSREWNVLAAKNESRR